MKHILKADCEEGIDEHPNTWHIVIYDDESGEFERITEFEYKT